MKIKIGTFLLAEGFRESDEEPETVATQTGQVASRCRSVDAVVFPRGNRGFTYTFSRTRDHGSFQAAERFRVIHPIDIPTTGTLEFVTEGAGGAEASIYFTSHNVDQVRIRQVGTSTISTYTITAAGPTTTRPTT